MSKESWNWSGCRSSKSKRSRAVQTAEIPSGCMCAVFQAFDFHPFQFSLNQQPSFNSSSHNIQQHLQSIPKGAEAPRNSLESEDGKISSTSKDENLKIPIQKNIRIRTSGARGGNLNDFSSETINSPGTKTPTLVARLMGLDLLPDAVHSSSSSSSSCLSTPNQQGHVHHHRRQKQHIQLVKHRNSTGSYNNGGIRSLHETPRSSDVEHRRLSLQINKENMDLDLPRFSFSKRKCNDENYNYGSRSPSHYARQIVKQVKESISRKVGLDITNTVKSREKEREEFVNQLRLKKSLKKSVDESSPGKHSSQSHSPRLSRFVDTKNKPSTKPSSPRTPKDQNIILKPQSPSALVNVEAQVSRVLMPQTLAEQELQNQKPAPKCKKISNEKFSSRLNKPQQTSPIIRKKQEETFIIRPPPSTSRGNDIKTKTKRTQPQPSNLLKNLNTTVSNLHPVKIGHSPPATKIPQKQVSETREAKRSTQLVSSCSSQRYKQEALAHTLATRGRVTNDENKSNGVSTTTEEGPEFQYISTILSRTTAPHQWLISHSHPLDSSIFHQLELYPTYNSTLSSTHDDKDSIFTRNNQLGPRCNRRLLFDLIGEVLSEIMVKPKCCNHDDGVLLLETVWNKVRSFPRAKCEVLEDIDGLIEMKDEEEEGREREEGLVAEIEGNIFETLVHETVTVMVGKVLNNGCCHGFRNSQNLDVSDNCGQMRSI